jgi:hypothetical protein
MDNTVKKNERMRRPTYAEPGVSIPPLRRAQPGVQILGFKRKNLVKPEEMEPFQPSP